MVNKKNILKLYENFVDGIYTMTNEEKNILGEIVILEDRLNATLTDEQKKLLDEIHTKENKRQEELYKNMFIEGFSLATKLFVEGMRD